MTRTTIACAVAALFAAATVATASEHEEREDHRERHEGRRRDRAAKRAPGVPADAEARALYRKECGACHLDFPPYFLPAESHRRLMAGLDRHFGQDAELDPAVRDRLERYLLQNAAEPGWAGDRAGLGGGTPARITETRWFRGKHRHIDARVTARGAVRSLANCAACHAGAVDWDFDDDRVKIPAG